MATKAEMGVINGADANGTSKDTNGISKDTNGTSNGKAALKVVFGAMTLGKDGAEGARIHDVRDVSAIIDILQKYGHNEIDTARVYGASEELLGRTQWQERGVILDTKLNPRRFGPKSYSHKPVDLTRGLLDSLKALNTAQVDLFYLHTPDHNTPYKETLEAVNNLYKAGLFKRFGISNYASWQVARIWEMCRANGWVLPTVYQGCYHALQRTVEPELFPCLRQYGIAFYSFSPLAGGMLSDKYHRDTTVHEPGSRFDPQRMQGKGMRGRYWNEGYFAALDVIRPAAEKMGISVAEASLRWLNHHSQLSWGGGDAVIVGASSVVQLEQNLKDLEMGPLPEEMVKAFDEGWACVKDVCGTYFM